MRQRSPIAQLAAVIQLEKKMVDIRLANPSDAESIISFDHVAQSDPWREEFIKRSIISGLCYVIEFDERIVAYGVLEYSFYEYGFIAMLYVHPEFRLRGLGSELMRHLENTCETEKLFTSTNQSNIPMQALLESIGYLPSGIVENLDEGDPELIYFKRPMNQAG